MSPWARRSRAERDGDAGIEEAYRFPVAARRASALRLVGLGGPAAARIEAASAGYLLAHGSSDIARHAGLLSPRPAAREVRAVVTPGRVGYEWHLDIAARDRPGLLAAFTGVLAARDLDVAQAVVATWGDGAALQAFVIRAERGPDGVAFHDALRASLEAPQAALPVPDAEVTFDGSGSALYTRCEVVAPDRPGLLHAVAVAAARAGASVHAAAIATVDGVAADCFDLSDRRGRKLTPAQESALRTALHHPNVVRRRAPGLPFSHQVQGLRFLTRAG